MRKAFITLAGFFTVLAAGRVSAAPQAPAVTAAVVEKYCLACHNARSKAAGLVLEGLDSAHPAGKADVWEKVVRKLRSQEMPPSGLPRPDANTYRKMTADLEAALDAAAAAKPNPGRVREHRL